MVDAARRELSGVSASLASGRYRLFANLGQGGMADVYLGAARGSMGFNRLVVVKKLREGLSQNQGFVTMFLDEGRLAARLNHPNVIHTYEIGEHSGTYFLAMEYLDGQPLSSIMTALATPADPSTGEEGGSRPRVEVALAVKIVAEALGGLHYAHELRDYDGSPLGIVHRDVSPHNLFVTYDGRVKLMDFGIAKAALNSGQTETGILKGKISYMAPEQAMGQPIDRRADIFPMGAVLWELLAGRHLILGDPAAALHKLLNEPLARLRDVVPGIDAELEAIVTKALAKDPGERFASAADMRSALEAWLRSAGAVVEEAQIGALVSDLFQRERVQVQARIKTYMSTTEDGTHSEETLTFAAPSIAPRALSGTRRAGQESDVSAVRSATESRSRRGLITATLGLLAVAAAGLLILARSSPPTSRSPSPAEAPSVSLTIVAAPPQCALFLDDVQLAGNPFVGKVPRDDRAHVVRAEAPGFATSSQTIRLQSDATYEFALTGAPSLPVAPMPSAAPTGAPTAAPTRVPRVAASGHAPQTIFEKDPWK